jgi:hypothetical protein
MAVSNPGRKARSQRHRKFLDINYMKGCQSGRMHLTRNRQTLIVPLLIGVPGAPDFSIPSVAIRSLHRSARTTAL